MFEGSAQVLPDTFFLLFKKDNFELGEGERRLKRPAPRSELVIRVVL